MANCDGVRAIGPIDYGPGKAVAWTLTPVPLPAGCTCRIFLNDQEVTTTGSYPPYQVSGFSKIGLVIDAPVADGNLRFDVKCEDCSSTINVSLQSGTVYTGGCKCQLDKTDTRLEKDDVKFSYDLQKEILTTTVHLFWKVVCDASNGAGRKIQFSVELRLSIYCNENGKWELIVAGAPDQKPPATLPCPVAPAPATPVVSGYFHTQEAHLDSILLASRQALLLLKCYFKFTGDVTFETVRFRRVGLRLTGGKLDPPILTARAWGGGNTDDDWGDVAKDPNAP